MLLAFDTATQTASVALFDLEANQLLAEQTWRARRRQTQDLLAAAQHLLAQLNISRSRLTALAVTTGPGSFTGVRIAVSTAKGIGLGLPITPKVIGLPTLNVTAAPWVAAASKIVVANGLAGQSPPATICAYIQAGRGCYNWAMISAQAATVDPMPRLTIADHHAGMATDFAAALAAASDRNPLLLVGEVTLEIEEMAATLAHVHLVDSISGLRRAGQLARLAADYFAAGVFDDLAALQPLYLRNL